MLYEVITRKLFQTCDQRAQVVVAALAALGADAHDRGADGEQGEGALDAVAVGDDDHAAFASYNFV